MRLINTSHHSNLSSLPSSAAWFHFRALSLIFIQRNTTFRWLHRKVNTRLQILMYDSDWYQSHCLLCLDHIESIEHFFYLSLKFSFWSQPIDKSLWPGAPVPNIQETFTALNFFKIIAGPSCRYEPAITIIVALSELRKAHWSFIIVYSLCVPQYVVSATSAAFLKLSAENFLYNLL